MSERSKPTKVAVCGSTNRASQSYGTRSRNSDNESESQFLQLSSLCEGYDSLKCIGDAKLIADMRQPGLHGSSMDT